MGRQAPTGLSSVIDAICRRFRSAKNRHNRYSSLHPPQASCYANYIRKDGARIGSSLGGTTLGRPYPPNINFGIRQMQHLQNPRFVLSGQLIVGVSI